MVAVIIVLGLSGEYVGFEMASILFCGNLPQTENSSRSNSIDLCAAARAVSDNSWQQRFSPEDDIERFVERQNSESINWRESRDACDSAGYRFT